MKRKKDPTFELVFKKTRVFSSRDRPHSGRRASEDSAQVQRVRECLERKTHIGLLGKGRETEGKLCLLNLELRPSRACGEDLQTSSLGEGLLGGTSTLSH